MDRQASTPTGLRLLPSLLAGIVAGIGKLLQPYLDLEGSAVCREREWLIDRARELRGLQVHMA
jgi:chloramphenicol 3-O-phosphotransferase